MEADSWDVQGIGVVILGASPGHGGVSDRVGSGRREREKETTTIEVGNLCSLRGVDPSLPPSLFGVAFDWRCSGNALFSTRVTTRNLIEIETQRRRRFRKFNGRLRFLYPRL
jgi:hypothetical protein